MNELPKLPPRRNQEQLRRMNLLTKWAFGLKADAELYCDDFDIRLKPALQKIDDALEQMHEIIEDDVVLQRWVTCT